MRSRRRLAGPPHWSEATITRDCQKGLEAFVDRRLREGDRPYRDAFDRNLQVLEPLLVSTQDLTNWAGVSTGREFENALRYLAGPPLSDDDLRTIARARRFTGIQARARVSHVVAQLLDPLRFPWVGARRTPTPEERRQALRWTAGLWAVEQVRTGRRSEESIECKVSNSEVNSVKRLIREAGGKARQWQVLFGKQVVTAAVLRGVFRPANVLAAQEDYGISVIWEHDLQALRRFLRLAR